MRHKKLKLLLIFLAIGAIAVFWFFKTRSPVNEAEAIKAVKPEKQSIQSVISTTATVLPKNRLEVKPPVNGRIDSILVKEGEKVLTGQTIAWMSSTERAALLDAARAKGDEELKYWQQVYKPIPLIAPIDAEVIVATTQPGQAVTTADAVIVLSDQLIVRAQVDETDIGKIKLGQQALVSLDAYPDVEIRAGVEHIYYESKTVNNVTMYEVDLKTEAVPEYFRSGMNASAGFIVMENPAALVIPAEAVFNEKGESFVLVKTPSGLERRSIKTGIQQDKKIEVISGLSPDDTVVITGKKYVLPQAGQDKISPFLPQPRRRR